jgi:hypothetical protein
MESVSHRESDPEDDPLAEQVMLRLRTLCEDEGWPVLIKEHGLLLRPWRDQDPPVRADAAVVTYGPVGSQKVLLLRLGINGSVPRSVVGRYRRAISLDCARVGVHVTFGGPAPAPGGAGREWQTLTLLIGLAGHSLNAECLRQTLTLLRMAFWCVLERCP